MSSHDDEFGPSTDWRAKYFEVADMLSETRHELDDFQHSSKELEEELERELERTERAQEDLKNKAARAESEREDWKSRFMTLQTQHNTTTTSLQRELDTLRQTHHGLKSQMRELEIGNDDLEGRERAVASSLADLESRYSKVLEEKILLEQELLDKASLEEECQRLKDDVRDLNEEVFVLKEQIVDAKSHLATPSNSSLPSRTASIDSSLLRSRALESLMDVPVELSDDSASSRDPSSATASVTALPTPADFMLPSQATVQQRAGFGRLSGTPVSLARSTTMPLFATPPSSRLPARDPVRVTPPRTQSAVAVPRATSALTKASKGVQMVREMGARVRTLDQKIMSRVPRIRMASITNRAPPKSRDPSPVKGAGYRSFVKPQKPAEKEKDQERGGAESPGWVLIMEEGTPQPQRVSRRSVDSGASRSSADRGTPSPTKAPSSFSLAKSSNTAPTSSNSSASGIRRPRSRLSQSTEGRSSIGSTFSTTSSVSTISSSRPTTPTFLPVPSTLMRATTITGAVKRSSLGGGTTAFPRSGGGTTAFPRSAGPPSPRKEPRPLTIPMGGRAFSAAISSLDRSQSISSPRVRKNSRDVSQLPAPTSFPTPQSNTPPLSSRIGRPAPSAFAGTSRRAQDDNGRTQAPGITSSPSIKASRLLRSSSFKS
ncbi:hypothetical protein BKA62DRAFT_213581 [Auriculariales sp. MPI-PUGE-AT-0066]|nr:hypothetical protein BKA62DRAFT_213581 [Auriculariales sp. MPI-PUGE-AT-0066]